MITDAIMEPATSGNRSDAPHLLLTSLRPESIPRSLLNQLSQHFPIEVYTAYRHRHGHPTRFLPLTKRLVLKAETIFLFHYLLSPHLYRARWRFVARHGHYATLLFARMLRALGQRRRVYLINFYLHNLGQSPYVKGLLRVLLTSDVQILAQSRSEQQYFSEFLPPENIAYIPYCQGESPHVSPAQSTLGEYVFAGGMVNRDYNTLFKCAEELPNIPFVVVASGKNSITQPTPPNVVLRFDLAPHEFDRLLAASRMVVVPLKEDVGSSGQMVLLKAMSLGKAVAISDIGAIRDYVDDGRTAVLYELGDHASLKTAIGTLHHDPIGLNKIGGAAREAYLSSFTPARYQRDVVAYIAGLSR